jgi:predicted outer membrane repeat protein
MYCYISNPRIINCTFRRNKAGYSGGGVYSVGGYQEITSCTFNNNETNRDGGGIHNRCGEQEITNCTFIDNEAGYSGGGIYCFMNYARIRNCTFSGNYATGWGGGGIRCSYDDSIITSCIFWGNEPDEIYFNYSTPEVTYCDVEGGWGGEGNIDINPLFVNMHPQHTDEWDLHLRWDSPCIDAGDPGFVAGEGEVDIDGEPRVMGGRVDMGADEVGEKQADFTRDGRIDVSDLAVLSGAWGTQEGDLRWYVFSDLFEDGVINLSDVTVFIEDWLWKADWYE